LHRPLDSPALRRHLGSSEHDALVREVEKAAAWSGAPFLAANAPLAEARVRWSRGLVISPDGSGRKVGVSEIEGGSRPRYLGPQLSGGGAWRGGTKPSWPGRSGTARRFR